MPAEPHDTRPTNGPADIPPDIEEEILAILDRTEPGPQRNAAISALDLSTELQHAVTVWLEQDEEGSGFLESPTLASTPVTDSGSLPRRLGEYELESVLGKGGMGIVYRARDLRLGRVVALKVLPERFADNPKRLHRFEREVRAVAALTHPSIVPVFVADKIGEVPYFTMELVAGSSLDKVIGRLANLDQPLSALRASHWREATSTPSDSTVGDSGDRTYLESVCRLVINIADALQHAHDNGVTHRDVKPSNILAEGPHRAKLFDFGLARLDDDLAMTQSSEIIGSPHYMSPEQIDGSVVDHRTDIYSLGVTLYELLTLKVPFQFDSPQQVYQSILNREPRRPGLINQQLPRDLETICLTAMEKDPDRRFQTAAELAEDLRRFLRFEPIQARPIGSVTRGFRWLRRNRASASIVVLAVISLILFLVTRETGKSLETVTTERDTAKTELANLKKDIDAKRKQLTTLQGTETQLKEKLETNQKELSKLQTDAADQEKAIEAQKRILTGLEAERNELATSNKKLKAEYDKQSARLGTLQKRKDELEAQRGELQGRIDEQRKTLVETTSRLADAKRRFGTLEQNYRVTTINKLLMEARTLRSTNAGLGLILAHEASSLADKLESPADPDLQARIADTLLELLRTTQEQLTYSGHEHPVTAIDFSPSGEQVVSTSAAGTAHVWERGDGRRRSLLRTTSALVHVEFAAPDWLVFAREDGSMLTWDGRSGSEPVDLENAVHQPQTRMHVAPGGQFVVSHMSRLPGQLRVHRRGSGRPERVLGRASNPIIEFEFGPVRDRIVATTSSGDIEIWGIDDGTLHASIGGGSALLSATFDAQGRRIASLDARGIVRVINVADETVLLEKAVERGRPLGAGRIAFCAGDRRLLISATGIDDHLLLDPGDGAELARITGSDTARGFELDRKRLLACVADAVGGFQLVNTFNGRRIARLAGGSDLGTTRERPVVTFSPDRDSVATAFGDTDARLWRTGPGGALDTVGPETADDFLDASSERLHLGRFEPANGRVVTLGNRGISSWHLLTGTRYRAPQDRRRPLVPQALAREGNGTVFADDEVRMFRPGIRPSTQLLAQIPATEIDQVIAWPGGGAAIILTGGSRDGAPRRLRILDEVGTRRREFDLPAGKAGGGTPLPSPDGARFLIGYDVLTVVEMEDPTRRVRLPFSRRPAAFAPDGMRVAASTGFSVKVWNARGGDFWCELSDLPQDYSEVTDLVFAPDGRSIATGWSDGMIRIHDVSRRKVPKPMAFRAHRGRVHSIRFSRDGERLVTASADGTTSVWKRADGRRRLTFSPGTPCVHAEFNQTGDRVVVVCPQHVHVFPLDLRTAATRARPRPLTAEERERFGLQRR